MEPDRRRRDPPDPGEDGPGRPAQQPEHPDGIDGQQDLARLRRPDGERHPEGRPEHRQGDRHQHRPGHRAGVDPAEDRGDRRDRHHADHQPDPRREPGGELPEDDLRVAQVADEEEFQVPPRLVPADRPAGDRRADRQGQCEHGQDDPLVEGLAQPAELIVGRHRLPAPERPPGDCQRDQHR